MIVLLSPAKTLDFSNLSSQITESLSRGHKDADLLAKQLSELDKAGLKALLKVSDAITR